MAWVLACAAVLLGGYVVAELAARWWLRHDAFYAVWLPGVRLQLHPDRSQLPEFEPVLQIAINADGERGDEIPRHQRGQYRVLAAGGSAVEGHSLDQASNWTAVLQDLLNTPLHLRRFGAGRAHVGGIGRSAVTAQDVDHVFRRVLPRYRQLDVVLVLIGAGDVVRWLASGAPSDSGAPPNGVPDLFACHPEGPFAWSLRGSALYRLAQRWRHRWLRPVKVSHGVGRWIVQARAMRAAATEIRRSTGDPTVMLDTFARYLQSSLERAKAVARRVVLLRTPWFEKDYTPEEAAHMWHGGLGHPWQRQQISAYYAFDVIDRLMHQMDERAAAVAEDLGVEHLDLKAVLEPSLDDYYDYTHFTAVGARKVAHAVAGALLRPPAVVAAEEIDVHRGDVAGDRHAVSTPSNPHNPWST
jgi:lysophospholipase L1-like esterase